MRGALIVFEGFDDSQKYLNALELAKRLKNVNINVEVIRNDIFPITLTNGFDEGNEIKYATEHQYFCTRRYEEFYYKILTKLESGTNVILCRYKHSGIAYSMANGMERKWCEDTYKFLPEPDIVLYLERSTYEKNCWKHLENYRLRVLKSYARLQKPIKNNWNNFIIDTTNYQELIFQVTRSKIYNLRYGNCK